jgi:hypothetical protein
VGWSRWCRDEALEALTLRESRPTYASDRAQVLQAVAEHALIDKIETGGYRWRRFHLFGMKMRRPM